MFLPIPGKPLEAEFQGLLTVLQQIGPVHYVIETPGRQRSKHLVHVNLLKEYFSRVTIDTFDCQIITKLHNVVNNETMETVCNTDLLTEANSKNTEQLGSRKSTELMVEKQSE